MGTGVTVRSATEAVELPPGGAPTISSSSVITRQSAQGLCGGLHLDMRVGQESPRKVRIILPITNNTKHEWQGSVKLNLGGTSVPLRIGSIPEGKTKQNTIHFNVDEGVNEINGSLLIGP